MNQERRNKKETVKRKWLKDIKENPTFMKMLFECNDENSLAGDLSYGSKL